jgi:hypothetical protein
VHPAGRARKVQFAVAQVCPWAGANGPVRLLEEFDQAPSIGRATECNLVLGPSGERYGID